MRVVLSNKRIFLVVDLTNFLFFLPFKATESLRYQRQIRLFYPFTTQQKKERKEKKKIDALHGFGNFAIRSKLLQLAVKRNCHYVMLNV